MWEHLVVILIQSRSLDITMEPHRFTFWCNHQLYCQVIYEKSIRKTILKNDSFLSTKNNDYIAYKSLLNEWNIFGKSHACSQIIPRIYNSIRMSDSKTEARENEVRLLITTKLHTRDSVVVKIILRIRECTPNWKHQR